MFNVKEGKTYTALFFKNGIPSTKEVVCKSVITNFQIGQMEMETTEEEYYPLYAIFKTKESAMNSYIQDLKNSIKIYKRSIKEKEKEILADKARIIELKLKLEEITK